jgi:hypothetical protein
MMHDFSRWDLSIFVGLELTAFWVTLCAQIVFVNIKTNDLIKHIQKPSFFDIFANRYPKDGIEQECFIAERVI